LRNAIPIDSVTVPSTMGQFGDDFLCISIGDVYASAAEISVRQYAHLTV